MGAPSMRPTRTTCSPVSEPPGIQSGQAACSCAPVTGCISTRRRSEWSPERAGVFLRSVSHRSLRQQRTALDARERHGHRALRGPHALRARDQRPVRGASMAALEHRRAATPVLPRRDRCRLRRLPWRSSGSVRGHQPAAAGRSGRATAASPNLVRPFPGYDSIVMRETTARSRYHGFVASFRHEAGRSGSATVNYTFSRNKADATYDNAEIDDPQNPLDKDAEFAAALHGPDPHLHGVLRLRTAVRSAERRRAGEEPCWEGGRSPGSPESNQARPLECRSSTATTTTGVSRRHCGPTRSAIRRPATRPACSGSTRRRSSHRPPVSMARRRSRRSACPAVTSGTSPCRRT